jgi:hypothetical protein
MKGQGNKSARLCTNPKRASDENGGPLFYVQNQQRIPSTWKNTSPGNGWPVPHVKPDEVFDCYEIES